MAHLPVSGLIVVGMVPSVGVLYMVGILGIIGSEVKLSTWVGWSWLSCLSWLVRMCVSVTLPISVVDWKICSFWLSFEVVPPCVQTD